MTTTLYMEGENQAFDGPELGETMREELDNALQP